MRARALALGSQLMTAQPGNIVLRCRLEKLSSDWQQLMTTVRGSESRVHAARMQLLPARQAFTELTLWLQSVEKTIHEGLSKSLQSSTDVQFEQQKYRVHARIVLEVNWRTCQMSVLHLACPLLMLMWQNHTVLGSSQFVTICYADMRQMQRQWMWRSCIIIIIGQSVYFRQHSLQKGDRLTDKIGTTKPDRMK